MCPFSPKLSSTPGSLAIFLKQASGLQSPPLHFSGAIWKTCPQCKEKNPGQYKFKRMLEESQKKEKKRMLDESHDAFDFLSQFFPMLFHDKLPLFYQCVALFSYT